MSYPRGRIQVERLATRVPPRHIRAMERSPDHPPARRHEAVRIGCLALGWLLIVATPLVGLLPGPGGVFVFAAGLALVLRNSGWAKRRYVRFKRRWPRLGHWSDRGLRRASARRRAVRDAAD